MLLLSNLAPAMAVSIGNNIEYIPDPRNFGIGTIDPQAKLDVDGDAIIRGSLSIIDGTHGDLKVLTSDQFGKATWTNIATTTSGLDFSNFVANMTLDKNTNVDLATFNLNYGSDLFVLNSSLGNIGVGTNNPADAKLQVAGDVKANNFLIGNVGLGFANSRLELTGGNFGLTGSLSAGNLGIGVDIPETALQVGALAAGDAIDFAGADGVYIAKNLEVDGVIYGEGTGITGLSATNFTDNSITAASAGLADKAKTLVDPDGSVTLATTTATGGINFTLADPFVVTNSEDETIFQVKNAAGIDLLTVNHDKVLMGGLSLTGPLTGTTIGANLISITPGPNNGFVGNGSRLTNLEAGDIVGAITAA